MIRQCSLAFGLSAVLLFACSESPASAPSESKKDDKAGSSTPGGAQTPGADPGKGRPEDCVEEPVQAVSQACCEAHGVDACGAGLFCARYDGREEATCYALGSRLTGQSCASDEQCASGQCGATGRCAALPGEACNEGDGCAKVAGRRYLCFEETCRGSDGKERDLCRDGADCDTQVCFENKCVNGEPGERCSSDSACRSGICYRDRCSEGVQGSRCDTNNDCAFGLECDDLECSPTQEPCASNSQCSRGGCVSGVCEDGEIGDRCDDNDDCEPSEDGSVGCFEDRCRVACDLDSDCPQSVLGLMFCIDGSCRGL